MTVTDEGRRLLPPEDEEFYAEIEERYWADQLEAAYEEVREGAALAPFTEEPTDASR